MKVGILSDSHDDMGAIARAVAVFNAEGVLQVLHAGDIVSPFTFELFRDLHAPLGGVFGNNDGDRLLLRERSAGALHVQPHFVTLDGLRGVIVHEPPLVKSLGAQWATSTSWSTATPTCRTSTWRGSPW